MKKQALLTFLIPHSSFLTSHFKLFLAFFIFHFSIFFCSALDFGLLLNQNLGIGNEAASIKDGFEYRADLWPRITYLIGDSGELYASAGLTLGINGNTPSFIPELLRTDFFYSFDTWGIRVGRMEYSDPLGIITTGLLDGARFSYYSMFGSFGVGVWYTGLLYKKNANITMTDADSDIYNAALDGDFFNTYFAPKRLLVSLDWEHPSIADMLRLKAAITAQIDLSSSAKKYHSQYLTVKATLPVDSFVFELGGSLEIAESDNFKIAYALDFSAYWTLPTTFSSRLLLTWRYASGNTNGTIGDFRPVTGKFYGIILKARLPAISMLAFNYTARINRSMGMSLDMAYFMRTDLGTYTMYPVSTDDNGYLLGLELYGRFVWSPLSDLQINIGGGAFIPALGNAGPKEKLKWHLGLNAVIALY
ncbi:MAG: hypothetical protein LBI14_04865 [Treponema sp.]|jgi:hypothetical protein|nr:hypothetical protein [Treponema sp.]